MRSETRKTEAMMALALFSLFAFCTLASVLVLADSGMRAVDAWHRLRGELRMISGEFGTTLAQSPLPNSGRIVRLDCQEIMQGAPRAAA